MPKRTIILLIVLGLVIISAVIFGFIYKKQLSNSADVVNPFGTSVQIVDSALFTAEQRKLTNSSPITNKTGGAGRENTVRRSTSGRAADTSTTAQVFTTSPSNYLAKIINASAIKKIIPVKVQYYGYSRDCAVIRIVFKISKCSNADQSYFFYDSTSPDGQYLIAPQEIKFQNLSRKLIDLAKTYGYRSDLITSNAAKALTAQEKDFKNCAQGLLADFQNGNVNSKTLNQCSVNNDQLKKLNNLVMEIGGSSAIDAFLNYTIASFSEASDAQKLGLQKSDLLNVALSLTKSTLTEPEIKKALVNDYASKIIKESNAFKEYVPKDNQDDFLTSLINQAGAKTYPKDQISAQLLKEILLKKLSSSSATRAQIDKAMLTAALNDSGNTMADVQKNIKNKLSSRSIPLSRNQIDKAVKNGVSLISINQADVAKITEQVNSASKIFRNEYERILKKAAVSDFLSWWVKKTTGGILSWYRQGYTWTSASLTAQSSLYNQTEGFGVKLPYTSIDPLYAKVTKN